MQFDRSRQTAILFEKNGDLKLVKKKVTVGRFLS